MKHLPGPGLETENSMYPPPAGGGLIEADAFVKLEHRGVLYPPPAGGGLIEARNEWSISTGNIRVSPARGRGPH